MLLDAPSVNYYALSIKESTVRYILNLKKQFSHSKVHCFYRCIFKIAARASLRL